MLEFLGGWVASSNFRLLVLLFPFFCDKNVGLVTIALVTIALVTVAEREHKPAATAVVIHPLNNLILNLPGRIKASLQ